MTHYCYYYKYSSGNPTQEHSDSAGKFHQNSFQIRLESRTFLLHSHSVVLQTNKTSKLFSLKANTTLTIPSLLLPLSLQKTIIMLAILPSQSTDNYCCCYYVPHESYPIVLNEPFLYYVHAIDPVK